MSKAPGRTPRRNLAPEAARATAPLLRRLLRLARERPRELLAVIPSNYAWLLLRRSYDAFATDRAYEVRPSSWLGPLGWWADRRVRSGPVESALRGRLRLVSQSLVEQVDRRLAAGTRPVRVLSAPCGLCRDLIQAATVLRMQRRSVFEHLEFHALDLDSRGDVIPEARRRLRALGIPATFYREDIFDPVGLSARARAGMKFQVVSCIGLAPWLTPAEVERLLSFLRDVVMEPGGTLLIDTLSEHDRSRVETALDPNFAYHPPEMFRELLERAGFRVIEQRRTANGVISLWVAEARMGILS
jgi:hypothetical protein